MREVNEKSRKTILDYDKCKGIALKYSRRVDLQKNNGGVYNKIRKNGWNELLNHMEYVCKPSGYWTYEECKEIALKYSRRVDLQKKEYAIYSAIHKNSWNELLNHMEYVCRPAGYWSYERCKEIVLKYDNWKDFIRENYAAYMAISKKKWQKKIGSHMSYRIKPNNYWTYERCKVVASKYNTIRDIIKSVDSQAYVRIKKEGWDELIKHFIELYKPVGYWTYEKCKEEALKYKTRKDFAENSMVAYRKTRKNKWFDLLENMPFQGNIKTRYIYAFEFENNTVYIGLTWNPEKRKSDHLSNKNSSVYKFLVEYNTKYVFKVISGELSEKDAQKEEAKKIKEYKNNGWAILNLATPGGLGAMRPKWSYEAVKAIVDTCTKFSEIYDKLPSYAICVMRKEGFYSELTKHLIHDIKPKGYWEDKERCRECASNFKYKKYFQKAYSGAYKAAVKFGWLNEFFKNRSEQLFDEWNNKEKCHLIALKYNSKKTFRHRNKYVYLICEKNGWLDDITSHMPIKKKLTYEDCKLEAANYLSRHRLEKACGSVYRISRKNGWLDDFYPKKK